MQCPSVSTGAAVFTHEPCTAAKCSGWKNGQCQERIDSFAGAAHQLTQRAAIPLCPLAGVCRWNQDALREGLPACEVRQLGMVCEHQGGEWNTFLMAPWEDWT